MERKPEHNKGDNETPGNGGLQANRDSSNDRQEEMESHIRHKRRTRKNGDRNELPCGSNKSRSGTHKGKRKKDD